MAFTNRCTSASSGVSWDCASILLTSGALTLIDAECNDDNDNDNNDNDNDNNNNYNYYYYCYYYYAAMDITPWRRVVRTSFCNSC